MRALVLTGSAWVLLTLLRLLPFSGATAEALEGAQSGVLLALVVVHMVVYGGWGTVLRYGGVAYLLALVLEICTVHTGFPFGSFVHHTPGPRIAEVPIVVPLAYVTYGWLAWTLARVIAPRGLLRVALGAVVLTGWDLGYDAIGSTVLDRYTYAHPGGFMGVPVSNFLGWLFTGALIMAAWEVLHLRHRHRPDGTQPRPFWTWPILVWALVPLPLWTDWLGAADTVIHRGDLSFVTSDVYGAEAVVATLVMGTAALAAAATLARRSDQASAA